MPPFPGLKKKKQVGDCCVKGVHLVRLEDVFKHRKTHKVFILKIITKLKTYGAMEVRC